MTRRGFALPAVLWVIVGVAAVSLAGTIAARDTVATAQNRVAHTRAAWRAEGCLEIARAAIGDALADGDRASASWSVLDSLVAGTRELADRCVIAARPAGAAIDANAASVEQLTRLFLALGARSGQADTLATALHAGRDRPFVAAAELREVPGINQFAGIDSALSVEPGRIPLGKAPLPVIASLPGVGEEAVARLAELRMRGEPPGNLLAFAASLSREARAELLARYPELVALVTTEPDAWIVTSRASEGPRAVSASIEVRLVRAGVRAAIVRRRTW